MEEVHQERAQHPIKVHLQRKKYQKTRRKRSLKVIFGMITKIEQFVPQQMILQMEIKIIQEEGAKHPLCIDGRSKSQKKKQESAVKVHCVEFNDSGIQLRATFLSKDSASGFQLLSDLRLSIKARFDQEGIEIPYPHRVVISETKDKITKRGCNEIK